MTVKWEKIEANVGVLEVEVGQDKVATALDQAFKKVVKRVNLPGFRKGKVPRKIFEARFGVESLYQDALDVLLPEAYSSAVVEAQLEPVDRPQIDIVQMEAGKPLVFKATVTVKPEVDLGVYKGITYTDKDFVLTEERIAEELEKIRKGHAELQVVEDGTVEAGDLVVMDFKGYVDGEAFEGGEAENYQLEIGSNTFVPGFEDQLIGAKAGESREVIVTFPADYHVKSLAGKEAKFDVLVHDVKRKVLPELDDEFAKDISEFETFEEFKADVVKKLEHDLAHEHEHYVQDAVVEAVVAQASAEIPEVMFEQEIDSEIKEFESRLSSQGIPLDAYQEFTGTTMEELREQFREEAQKRVKTSLVLDAVARAENIQVTEDEVSAELQKFAESTGLEIGRVVQLLQSRDPGLMGLRAQILSRKTVEFLVEHSVRA
ncbi:trigger factor [Sulfoacidibacillus thermotolerans]|uniref:Trigger factor n=1 Tax=Sulfoacidibacillus thermotolerans TaxID=1765684 RepID=A0A2U3DC54_SULT2|nr:trigger factor [Sulfoacidibacillus thermotolerans]PWI58860.1 trigger factor [Sulfoacidibacillus thermotolerans]